MILLEGFLVRLMIGITKNPSRRIINVTWMSKRMGLQTPQYLSVQSKLAKISEGFKREICGFVEKSVNIVCISVDFLLSDVFVNFL